MNIFITKKIIKYLEKNNKEENFKKYLSNLSKYSIDEARDLNKFDIKEIFDVPVFDYKGGERLYGVQVKNTDFSIYSRIERYINTNEDTLIFIELHPSSAHDRQSEIADNVSNTKIFQIAYSDINENCEEKNVDNQLFLFLRKDNKFETLLTVKQQEALVEKENENNPMLITGTAGSGKTEIGIQYIETLIQKEKNSSIKSKILCVTYNENLLKKIKKRINDTNIDNNITFHTIETLLNYIREKYEQKIDKLIFDDINNFIEFKKNISDKKIKKFLNNNRKVLSIFDKYDDYILYSEIYGLIYGSMLLNAERDLEKENRQITKEHYLNNISKDYSVIDIEDKYLVYDISSEYLNYLEEKNISTYNSKCLQSISCIQDEDKFDKVIIDEVQDLTECEIYLLLKFSKKVSGLFFAGDKNQVINPTFFDFGRIGVLLHNKFDDSKMIEKYFYENFRNSQKVSELAYLLNKERKELFYSKLSDKIEEPYNYTDSGNIYYLNNSIDELKEYIEKDAKTVVITSKQSVYDKLKEKFPGKGIFHTVENYKGLEENNIILYNFFTEDKEKFSEMYNKNKKINSIYKYIFNKLYVGVTRAINSLIIVEDDPSPLELLDKIRAISSQISSKDEMSNIEIKERFEDYYYTALNSMENKIYADALIRFKQAKQTDKYKKLNIKEKEDFDRDMLLCDILGDKDTTDLQKAEHLEKNKFYKESISFYEKTGGNYTKIALLYLLIGDSNKWKKYLLVSKNENENINIEDYDIEIACFLSDMFKEMKEEQKNVKENVELFLEYSNNIKNKMRRIYE